MTGFDLTGKKAFVTGASRGIGRIIAIALAAAGADVAIAARNSEGLAETAREVTALGRKAFVFPLDVTRQEDVAAAVSEAIRLLGQLDIVVNNASVLVTEMTPALAAPYGIRPGAADKPATDATLITEPPPRSRRCAPAAWQT